MKAQRRGPRLATIVVLSAIVGAWAPLTAAWAGPRSGRASKPARADRRSTQTPDSLARAWRRAVDTGDAALAWSLLSPAAQAETDLAAFSVRFEQAIARLREPSGMPGNAGSRAGAAAADPGPSGRRARGSKGDRRGRKAGRASDLVGMRGGTTAHEGGSIVRWVEVDGRYLAISGLGDPFSLDTPRGAVRALIHAAVSTDLSAFEGLLDDELLARTAEDLGARIGLIATALEETDFVIGEDGQVATLAYAPGRTLSLRKIDGRWRITALE